MFRKRFFIILLSVIASVFFFSVAAFAANNESLKSIDLKKYKYDVKILENKGIQEIYIKDAKNFLKENGYKIPDKCSDIEVTIQLPLENEEIDKNQVQDSDLEIEATGYYVVPYMYSNETDLGDLLGVTSGSSGEIELRISTERSASYGCSISVSAEVISAGVNYDVTKGYTITNSCTEDTYGNYTEIKGYPIYRITDYDVYYNDTHKGTGWAMKPIGVSFVTIRY